MKTFILLTFGFLGFAFYELSGGADFEPASAKFATATPQKPAKEKVATAPAIKTVEPVATASITQVSQGADVTRVSLNLTDTGSVAEQTPPKPAAKVTETVEQTQIILPSLIATTGSSISSGTVSASDGNDLRTVSGNRVNVRGGPSTDYGVVSKLSRGEEVRILEDNGDGWVRMQPVSGGESGWMADFLLTSG